MRATRTAVFLGLVVAAVSVIGQASAAAPAGTSTRCALHAQIANGQISSQGALVGSASCGRPFGKGSYHGALPRQRHTVAVHRQRVRFIEALLQSGDGSRQLYGGPGIDLRDRSVPRDVPDHGRVRAVHPHSRDAEDDLRPPHPGADQLHAVGPIDRGVGVGPGRPASARRPFNAR